jgi:hypothetical protein
MSSNGVCGSLSSANRDGQTVRCRPWQPRAGSGRLAEKAFAAGGRGVGDEPRSGEFTAADLERLRALTREAIEQCRDAVARCRETAEEAGALRMNWWAARAQVEVEREARAMLRAQGPPPPAQRQG